MPFDELNVVSNVQELYRKLEEVNRQMFQQIADHYYDSEPHGDEVLVLKDDDFTVANAEGSMTVGPCFGMHHFTEGKEDSEAKTPGAATVYLTDYTEFHHVISIRP